MDHALCSTVRHSTMAICAWVCSALLLSGCSLFRADPDEVAAEKMQELLLQEAFGDAVLGTELNKITVSSTGEAEAGVFLRPTATADMPIIVRFVTDAAEPLNIRLNRDAGFDYRSTATETYVLLGPGQANEVLLYGAAPLKFVIEVEAVETCGKGNFLCQPDGRLAFTPALKGLKKQLVATPYQNAQLNVIKGKRLVVRPVTNSGEYGVYLSLASAPIQRTIVSFRSDADANSITIRTGIDGDIRYFPGSRGWARINETRRVLLYSSDPVGFELEDITLDQCTDNDWRCRTEEDFNLLLPGRTGDTSLDRALKITEWASRNADFSLSASIANGMELAGLSASQIYFKYYEKNQAGGFCGATAVFLARTLRSQGYDAFTFDFGLKDGDLTHVTTIAAIEGKFYMLDATFGGYLSIPGTNAPIDLMSVLDGSPFDFTSLNMDGRDFLVAEERGAWLERNEVRRTLTDCRPVAGTGITRCSRANFGLAAYLDNFSSQLEASQLDRSPETLIALMRHEVFNIGSTEDTDSMRQFAKELAMRGLNISDNPNQPSAHRLLVD